MLDYSRFNTTIGGKKLAELEIDTQDKGLINFWHFARNIMLSRKNSALVLKPTLNEEWGGANVDYSSCSFIVMRPDIYQDGKLKFKNEQAACFIHELCHYLHYNYMDGKYTAEHPYKGQRAGDYNRDTYAHFYIELEAWALSRKFQKMYNIDLADDIDFFNKRNMLIVSINDGFLSNEMVKRIDKETYEDYRFRMIDDGWEENDILTEEEWEKDEDAHEDIVAWVPKPVEEHWAMNVPFEKWLLSAHNMMVFKEEEYKKNENEECPTGEGQDESSSDSQGLQNNSEEENKPTLVSKIKNFFSGWLRGK